MRILILGGDGYLGWPVSMHFATLGHSVRIIDNCAKRLWEMQVGGKPLWPVPDLYDRAKLFEKIIGKKIEFQIGDVTHHYFMYDEVFKEFKPDVIIHFAEQPSAPLSMKSLRNALYTQSNNVLGTLVVLHAMRDFAPDAHLEKLGTMGEYGTPNIDIEEGYIDIVHNGRCDTLPFPKLPGSFYHASKVHDSTNIHLACKIWNLRATDLNQGIVYGIDTNETLLHPDLRTSFHYDAVFGTVINRFCVQAVAGVPLTVYGTGGQMRAYLDIRDTIQCLELAMQDPAEAGKLRVRNQFTQVFSVLELAEMVKIAAKECGVSAEIGPIENPRTESESHYYNPKNSSFLILGLKPHLLTVKKISEMIKRIQIDKRFIDTDIIYPKVKWNAKN